MHNAQNIKMAGTISSPCNAQLKYDTHPLSVVLKHITTPVHFQVRLRNRKALHQLYLKAVCCHVCAVKVSRTEICLTLLSTNRRLGRSKQDVEERNDHPMTS